MVQSGLVGWWPLHEWNGQVSDISGSSGDGTNNGASQGTLGPQGLTSYKFNSANNEYATVNGDSAFSHNFQNGVTMSIWVRPDLAQQQGIFSVDDTNTHWSIRFSTSSISPRFEIVSTGGNGLTVADTPLPLHEWSHIAGMYDGTQPLIYVNGELKDIGSNPTSFDDPSGVSRIGQMWLGQYLDGSCSDARIYNRPLSPSEVQALYEMGSRDLATPPDASDPSAVSRYSFDDRSDTTTALDEWGSNDGTINGAVYSANSVRNSGLSMQFDASDYVSIGTVIPDSVRNQYIYDDFSPSNWPDSVGSSDISTITGPVAASSAFSGEGGVSGDGTDGYAQSDTMGSFGSNRGSDFAISVPFNTSDTGGMILAVAESLGDTLELGVGISWHGAGSGELGFRLRDSAGNALAEKTSGSSFNDGSDHHLIINKVGNAAGGVEFYVDDMDTAVSSTNETDDGFGNASVDNLPYPMTYFARSNDGTIGQYLDITLGDVRWFSNSLTATERNNVHNSLGWT